MAAPFDPKMGRARRPVPGWTQAVAFGAVLVCAAWGGQHGLGDWIGRAAAVAALVAILVAIPFAGARFAGWAVRAIRDEVRR